MTKTTLRDILNLVFRHSVLVWSFCLIVVAGAVTYYFQAPRVYKSTAKVMVTLGSESLGRMESLDSRNVLFTQRSEQLHNEQEILKSNAVLSTVSRWIVVGGEDCPGGDEMSGRVAELRRYFNGQVPQPTFFLQVYEQILRVYDDLFGHKPNSQERIAAMAQVLNRAVGVKPIFDSDTLELTFQYRNPTVAQTLLELVLAAYYQHHIRVFENNGELVLLKREMDASTDNYKNALAQYSQFVGKHSIFNDGSQADLLVQQRNRLSEQLTAAEAVREETARRAAALDGIQNSLHEYETFSTVQTRNREREALNRQLNDAEVEAHKLLTKHPETSRVYQDEEAQIREIRNLLEHEPAEVTDQTEHRKSKAYEMVEGDRISLHAQLEGNEARVALIKADLAQTEGELAAYAANLQKFNMLKLDMERAKHESEIVAESYLQNQMRIQSARNALTNVSTIDAPSWNPIFTSPNKKLLLVATFLLLVAGSMAVVVAAHYLDTTISSPRALTTELGVVPFAASIPYAPARIKDPASIESFLDANQREFARLYQVIQKDPSKKVVLIAKSRSGEGSSLIGLAFARFLSLASGRPTAFIDRTSNAVTESADGVVVESCGGSCISQLQALRAKYDTLVIATEPVRDATDLDALSPLVGSTLFLVEAEKTRTEAAHYNLDLLRRFGFQNIQIVLNKRRFHIPAWMMRFV